ncbi:acyl-CoA thioesterase II [Phenylobacterium deserti]|uniref:Acyl-CoA thioesterase 2 n=1 Tax=Phenylobacterium deserti TaxID=1914756 RepID=A0A328ARR2_9CAUL|nr:acyl-CoA thioesterase II [Phenylobacterium deserti]RAK57239.1 acyl-CoA thioesterase II [Phenylobacterium deserti]
MDTDNLVETLKLERIEVNLFRGDTPDKDRGRIFGGQVIAQSLLAAYETVEERICHSLHCYFIRPGDPRVPIVFEVDRARDGGSFTTRRVIAVQHGQQIFNLAASFQAPEDGLEHQTAMPANPDPQTLEDDLVRRKEAMKDAPEAARRWLEAPQPIEIRSVDLRMGATPPAAEAEQQVWFRARAPIGDDPRMHQVILAYASDMSLLGTALRPHGVGFEHRQLQAASLDHAMWFHKPFNFNDWLLYAQDSPSASGGRGFARGAIYDQSGVLVASTAQEGLIRMRKPKD